MCLKLGRLVSLIILVRIFIVLKMVLRWLVDIWLLVMLCSVFLCGFMGL